MRSLVRKQHFYDKLPPLDEQIPYT
ncbi:uncharacterized protein METZ01_LOCUS176920, partial [marine metagenome]